MAWLALLIALVVTSGVAFFILLGIPMPFVSTAAAERFFRHKVIAMLRDEELLTQERIVLLLSWRHTGFQPTTP